MMSSKVLRIFVIVLILLTSEGAFASQAGPRVETSPEFVPYKPGHSNLPPVQPCPDFQLNPEKDVLYKRVEEVTLPKVTRGVSVSITEQGKEAYQKNLFTDPNDVVSRISIVVDKDGKPRDPCLAKAAGFDLDQQAAEAAMQYKFKPALKDGKPIAMRFQIWVKYETH